MRAWCVRVLAAFLLAVLTSSSTIAWALPCCAHEAHEADETERDSRGAAANAGDGCCAGDQGLEQDADQQEDEPCSCPLDCAPCCAGAPAPAIVPLPVAAQAYFEAWTILELTYRDREPPDGAGHDVLHVPRRPASRI